MSSELANRISLLKGQHTSADIVKHADVSHETLRKLESGESIKLSTVRKIADYLGATQTQWRQLVIAWIKLEIGPEEAKHIQLSPKASADSAPLTDAEQIAELARQLDAHDRKQILLAITRPEVRRCLPGLNNLYNTIRRKADASAKAAA